MKSEQVGLRRPGSALQEFSSLLSHDYSGVPGMEQMKSQVINVKKLVQYFLCGLDNYDQKLQGLSEPIWEERYLSGVRR